jgi:hypothetical protein
MAARELIDEARALYANPGMPCFGQSILTDLADELERTLIILDATRDNWDRDIRLYSTEVDHLRAMYTSSQSDLIALAEERDQLGEKNGWLTNELDGLRDLAIRDDEVEAAAEALFSSRWATLSYRVAPDDLKDVLREAARAALLAAWGA